MSFGEEGRQIVFGEEAALSTTMQLGAILQVRLAAQPAAGFSWQLVSFDQTVLAVLESRFERRATGASQAVAPPTGAPADHLFVLKALKAGKTAIVFAYGRSWEKDKPPMKGATLNVNVQP